MEHPTRQRYAALKDLTSLVIFIISVVIGVVLINSFIFRSFNVEGPSMEKTLYTGDRLIVDLLPVTWAKLQNKPFIPQRGQIIVFENPLYNGTNTEQFIVKRVIAFPGEHVVLKDGHYTVYNTSHPDGFNPDDANHGEPGSPTSGQIDTIVPGDTIFVSGDHRQGSYSFDSRNGMGPIPFHDIIGPVSARIFPFTAIRGF